VHFGDLAETAAIAVSQLARQGVSDAAWLVDLGVRGLLR